MKFIEDLFGRGGSHNQGTPTTGNPGDGSTGQQITNWLERITGAYNAVVGANGQKSPAPAPAAMTQPKGNNTTLYLGIGLALAVVAFLMFKRR